MTRALRSLVREILLCESSSSHSKEFAFALGEFIAANEPIDLKQHMDALAPYVRVYTNLYRVWMHYDSDVPVERLEAEASQRETQGRLLSTTRDPKAILRMLDELGANEDVAITRFDGEGFDPYEVLGDALKQHPDHEEIEYLRSALNGYAYQKEIVVLRILGRQEKVNDV